MRRRELFRSALLRGKLCCRPVTISAIHFESPNTPRVSFHRLVYGIRPFGAGFIISNTSTTTRNSSTSTTTATSNSIRSNGNNNDASLAIMSESEYHDIADETLHELMEMLGPLEEAEAEALDADISLSQGVLNIHLQNNQQQRMSWVINKQTPNRQLWWSSPISGPRRYEWNNDESRPLPERWGYTRAGGGSSTSSSGSGSGGSSTHTLFHTLRTELLDCTGIDIAK